MRVRVLVDGWVEVKAVTVSKVAKCQAEKLCLACEKPLSGKKIVRGCHERCAKATYRAIISGKTTDSKRVADGKWLPAENGGRKPSNPVSLEFSV